MLVSLVPTAVAAATGDRLPRAVTCLPRDLACPIVAVLPDQEASVRLLSAEGGSIPAYADPQAAAHALAHAVSRAEWLSRDAGRIPPLEGIHSKRAAGIAASYLSAHPEGGWLEPRDGAALLDCYGIPQLPWRWAENEDEAVREAERLSGPDGPVVLKAYVPGVIHKTEQHAVRLDLRGDAQIRAAHRDFVTRFHGRLAGVLVQPLAERGLELLAGVVQDDVFGPLVLFGLGGTATEVLADHAARLAPLADQDVHDLISTPRCAPLLLGHRGAKPVDVGCLEQLLLRLSRLAGDLPELAEADFNPVIAGPDGVAVADVRIRLDALADLRRLSAPTPLKEATMMKHDMVGTVMTSDVVRATADTTFREIVRLLDDHRISGLPVVDDGQRVIGVISESDLLAHAAAAEDRQGAHHARWSSLIRKGHDTDSGVMTLTARRLMTLPAVYAYAHESIAQAARIMARHGIERLPVVDEENRLVGIVTRRDLLKVFLRPDAEIRRVVAEDVLDRTCWIPPGTLDVEVRDGVVTVSGQLGRRSEIPPVLRLIQQVDGVVSVVDRLTCRYEDHSDDPSKEPPPNLATDRLRDEERRGV